MSDVKCTDCEAPIVIPDDAVDGEIVTCPDCGLDLEVEVAFRTDLQVVLERFPPHHLAAAVAFQPKAFRANVAFALLGRIDARFVAGEPGHIEIIPPEPSPPR